MSWVHPATLRLDSQTFRCTARVQLFSNENEEKAVVRANRIAIFNGDDPKTPLAARSTKLSILKSRDRKIKQEHNIRLHEREQMQLGV